MSVGHCGNGCDWDPRAGVWIKNGCRKSGCYCALIGPCKPWWLPFGVGMWLFKRGLTLRWLA